MPKIMGEHGYKNEWGVRTSSKNTRQVHNKKLNEDPIIYCLRTQLCNKLCTDIDPEEVREKV